MKETMKLTKLQILLIFISFLVIAAIMLNPGSSITINLFSLGTILLCILNMYRSRKNILGFILHFQLFYYNYSVVFSRYLHIVHFYDSFYTNANQNVLGIGIACLFIFELCMTFCYKNIKEFNNKNIYAEKSNEVISIVLLVASLLVGILGFDWSSYGSRGSVSTYYEYIGILLVLGLYYSGYNKSKLIKYGYSLLIFFLVIQGLIFGERVSALQFIFIWLFYFMGDKINSKSVLLFGFVGIFLMSLVGAYRSSYQLNSINISEFVNKMSERLLTFDGSDLGYYCSLTFIMVAHQIDTPLRFDMFKKFLLSILIGNSNEASLPIFTRQFYAHWNGGYYPLYFYFYGGFLLVFIASFIWCSFLCGCIKDNKKNNSKVLYLLGMYLICISARWYMYSPVTAFRPTILFLIAYFGLSLFNKFFSKKGLNYEENK